MPVVSNTSPILNLAIINQLDLLRQQFGVLVIPLAVLGECKLETQAGFRLAPSLIGQVLEAAGEQRLAP